MKKYILLIIIILFILHCKKETSSEKSNIDNKNRIEYTDQDQETGIDFEMTRKKIQESDRLDIDVFFAISVFHKYYISQFIEEVDDLPKEEQKRIFSKKKKEFFKSIKYSEEEYNQFMQNNTDKMNLYINTHKDIQEYLLSIN